MKTKTRVKNKINIITLGCSKNLVDSEILLSQLKGNKMDALIEMINKYGFPIVAAGGTGYMIFYVWQWATQEVKPVLSAASNTLIALIDRVRMLDNDLIRLNQKVDVVLHLRGKIIDGERVVEQQKVDREADEKFRDAVNIDSKK